MPCTPLPYTSAHSDRNESFVGFSLRSLGYAGPNVNQAVVPMNIGSLKDRLICVHPDKFSGSQKTVT
jgi:hypothetical protein